MAELRRLTTHCQFGAYLDEALRDRLVCGLRNEGIQKKLLTEADLTLARALELSLGMKAAEKNAKSLKVTEPAVNRITHDPATRAARRPTTKKSAISGRQTATSAGRRGTLPPFVHQRKKTLLLTHVNRNRNDSTDI